MKNKFILIISCLSLFVLSAGWTVPEVHYYIKFDDQEIYMPTTANGKLSEWDYGLINISNSNITGYMTVNNEDVTVYFQPFRQPYYRLDNTTALTYLSYTEYETNLKLVTQYDLENVNWTLIVASMVGGLLFLELIKRRS